MPYSFIFDHDFLTYNRQEQLTQELELGFDKSPVSRYYGDAQKEAVLKYRKIAPRHSANSVHRGQKPMIPAFFGDERNEGRHLALATVTDGSCVVLYPLIYFIFSCYELPQNTMDSSLDLNIESVVRRKYWLLLGQN